MLRLALLWVLNAIALLSVAYLLPTVHVDGLGSALLAALVLGFALSFVLVQQAPTDVPSR